MSAICQSGAADPQTKIASRPRQTLCFATMRRLRFLLILLPVAFFGCQSPQRANSSVSELLAERAKYPAHWWTPVPTNGAPGWEILPQAAGPGEVILSKRNELGLLSNFAATRFDFNGKRYASLEGVWQMM